MIQHDFTKALPYFYPHANLDNLSHLANDYILFLDGNLIWVRDRELSQPVRGFVQIQSVFSNPKDFIVISIIY